ncbi:hypothetical protein [uncultured Microbulbifer sp.]|uniref:hypothetical protein n=1 Tax=uncultured Microbulbifer sp. TaxID=348147 RepID=UPI00260F53CF|nr:hypothetical protein [uncultured Microbulbifer sp.]
MLNKHRQTAPALRACAERHTLRFGRPYCERQVSEHMKILSKNRDLVLQTIKVLGYLNFCLFFLGFLNSKGGGDYVSLFLPATLFVATITSLVYLIGFKYLHLPGKRMDYWFCFRPYVWLVVIFSIFLLSIFSIDFFGNENT